jgi:hypothetical protein
MVEVCGRWGRAPETIMKHQSQSLFLSASDVSFRSFWQRMIDAMEARQRRAAEREIAKHLHFRCGRHHDDFRVELERRLLGQ